MAELERAVTQNEGLQFKRKLGDRCFHFEEVTTFTDDMVQIDRLVYEHIVPKAKLFKVKQG